MSTPFSDLLICSSGKSSFDRSSDKAYALGKCFNCAGQQMAVIAYSENGKTAWLRCVNCSSAMVLNADRLTPNTLPLSVPQGLEGRELEVWQEARECLGVGAWMAAVMLCRKLLLHVAVAHDLPEVDDKGRTPTFDTAVKHLEEAGVITRRMRPWVDRIRTIGNDANHELAAISSTQANDVALFTEQLLRLAYEMNALMAASEIEVVEPGQEA